MSLESKTHIIAGEIAQVDTQINEMKKQLTQLHEIITTFEVIRETYQAYLDNNRCEQLELELHSNIVELVPSIGEEDIVEAVTE
jgi:uncharacterized protein involved in exopolysaccharide biosynthesis